MQTNQKTCIYSLFMQHTLGRLFVWKAGNQAAVPFDLDGSQLQTWADCFQRTRLQRVRRLVDALVHVQVDALQAEHAEQRVVRKVLIFEECYLSSRLFLAQHWRWHAGEYAFELIDGRFFVVGVAIAIVALSECGLGVRLAENHVARSEIHESLLLDALVEPFDLVVIVFSSQTFRQRSLINN